ncbi:MAG: hypothetical protein WA160_04930 [Pseudobdellovibrio sp.]
MKIQNAYSTPDINVPITGENYGFLKAQCEEVVLSFFKPSRSLILRLWIIVGAYDDSNRFNQLILSILDNQQIDVPNAKTFPMYVDDANWKGFFQFDGNKAYLAGFRDFRIEDTIKYVANFLRTGNEAYTGKIK